MTDWFKGVNWFARETWTAEIRCENCRIRIGKAVMIAFWLCAATLGAQAIIALWSLFSVIWP